MEYVIRDEGIYKGDLKMSKEKKKKEKSEQENNEQTTELAKQLINLIKLLKRYIFPIFCSVLGAAIVAITTWINLKNDISDLKISVDNLNTEIVSIKEDNDMFDSYLYEDGGVKDQLGDINKFLNIATINISDEFTVFVEEYQNEYKSSNKPTNTFNSETLIGKDEIGRSCIAKDYINKTILLTYKDKANNGENVDVYFLGQYNENYHWNGFCVTNVYYSDGNLNGKLHEICESNFDDGKRLDFKSIHYNINEKDWLFSDRTITTEMDEKTNTEKQINIGVNKHYLFDYNKEKNFTESNVRASDILYVDNFLKSVNPIMTKYYSGNTSDGYFNDDTGNAYRVTYYEDGTVESIYVGKFVDGYPNDDTGNAWKISYSENTKGYEYYKGNFDDDNDEYKSNDTPTPISIDEINKIVSEYNFACELKWK